MTDIKKGISAIPALVKMLKLKFEGEQELTEEEKAEKLKAEEEAKAAAENKFIDVKTTEGMILRYEGDTPQVGQDVLLVKEDGTTESAPDGEHELEGGIKVTIQDGKFTMVTPGEGDEEEMKEAEIQKKISELRELGVVIEEMKKDNEKKDEAIEDLKEEITETKETMREMFKIVEKLSEQPSEKPTEKKKDGFSAMSSSDVKKDIAEFKADLRNQRLQRIN